MFSKARHGGLGPQGGRSSWRQNGELILEERQNVALLPLSELMESQNAGVNANEQFSFLLEYESY